MPRSFGQEISGNRLRSGELTEVQRAIIISKREEGVPIKSIATEVDCAPRTVTNTIKRWKEHQSIATLPRSGRPTIIGTREARQLHRIARKNPKIQYRTLRNEAGLDEPSPLRTKPPSRSTIYRVLKDTGLTKRRCKVRPTLKIEHVKLRREFERRHRDMAWGRTRIRFSDECSIEIGSGAEREWAFSYPHEIWDHDKIQEKEKGKKLSQMVWASIWVDNQGRPRRSELIIMERDPDALHQGYSSKSYIKTLEEGLLPYYRPGDIFQQDNARIHTSKAVKEWFESHGIEVLEWPPYSPDLNPIEHMWWALKKLVHKLHPELITLGKSDEDIDLLCNALKEAWRKIPNDLILKLINSMPDRMEAVRRARGWQTKY